MPVLVLLIAWPLAELFVAIVVAGLIGVPLTVVALLAGWPVGAVLLRSEGRAAWRRLANATTAGRPPGREVVDGALIIAGGALLIVPGFITDGAGLLLLLAPTRALARGAVQRNIRGRLVVAATRFGRGGRPSDVDATASDLDRPRLGL